MSRELAKKIQKEIYSFLEENQSLEFDRLEYKHGDNCFTNNNLRIFIHYKPKQMKKLDRPGIDYGAALQKNA